jgi:cytochrome c oxidase assembly protein subunit 17
MSIAETSPINSETTDINSSAEVGTITSAEPKPLKPCCACPQTKKTRDECIALNGEEACIEVIEKHKECLRSHGFNVK